MEDNKKVVRRYFDDFWNRNNPVRESEFIDPKVKGHVSGKSLEGIDVIRKRHASLRTVYSDIHFHIEDLITEGDKVVARWTFHGEHTGSYMGHPPTGKMVQTNGINMFIVTNGKITDIWVNSDDLGELEQLGINPSSAG